MMAAHVHGNIVCMHGKGMTVGTHVSSYAQHLYIYIYIYIYIESNHACRSMHCARSISMHCGSSSMDVFGWHLAGVHEILFVTRWLSVPAATFGICDRLCMSPGL